MQENSGANVDKNILELQREMYHELKEVRNDIAIIKIQTAQNSATISVVSSLLTTIVILFLVEIFKKKVLRVR